MIVDQKVSKSIFIISVGNEIFRLRKKRGLSGKQLADKLNISQQQVSRYERGVCNINVDTLFVILYELDCCLSDFFSSVYFNVNNAKQEVGTHYINLFLPSSPYYHDEGVFFGKKIFSQLTFQ